MRTKIGEKRFAVAERAEDASRDVARGMSVKLWFVAGNAMTLGIENLDPELGTSNVVPPSLECVVDRNTCFE
jgi:hypothetical protein